MTNLYDIEARGIDGAPHKLSEYAGKTLLIVNVASQCGFTPQYKGLEALYRQFAPKGLVVLGFPCNQFGGQEPGSNAQIKQFCSTTFHVTFPLFDKVEVNGPGRHPLFAELEQVADPTGYTGDVRWNFEKWLVDPQGEVVARFAPTTKPDDPSVVAAIESALPSV